jgi:hypothetical protein
VKLYLPDESDSWNDQRMIVLATAMEKFLLPHLKEEVGTAPCTNNVENSV